jgi:hypothetical protein
MEVAPRVRPCSPSARDPRAGQDWRRQTDLLSVKTSFCAFHLVLRYGALQAVTKVTRPASLRWFGGTKDLQSDPGVCPVPRGQWPSEQP